MKDTLQTHGVTTVADFSDLQGLIRRMEHLDPWPEQPLLRWNYRSARTVGEAVIQTEMHCVPGHTGIPGKEEADSKANFVRECCGTCTVTEQVYTTAAKRSRRRSEQQMAAKAQWEADKCSNHQGYKLKCKAGSKRHIPMESVKPLAARFYRLKRC
jgi:hypothetical protein